MVVSGTLEMLRERHKQQWLLKGDMKPVFNPQSLGEEQKDKPHIEQ